MGRHSPDCYSSLLPSYSHFSCLLSGIKLATALWDHEGSLDINSLGIETLSPTTCEELNPDINHMNELGGRPFPIWPLTAAAPAEIFTAACEGPWNRGSCKAMTGFLDLQKLWGLNCSFTPLNFGLVIYHVAIGNWYSSEYMGEFSYNQNNSLRVWFQEALLVLFLISKIQVLLNLGGKCQFHFMFSPTLSYSPYLKI